MITRDPKQLSDRVFDIIVIGAGVYGAATAWEAALRGLSVALIDQGDFCGKTSANSLKIIHGGLRYLQQLDIKRMRESIRERRIMMKIAPHLVHPLQCIMPTSGHMIKGPEVMRLGLLANDIISWDRNRKADPQKRIPMGRIISRADVCRLAPGIDTARINGGAFWTDAQVYNTERLVLAMIQSAADRGAVAVNYMKAVDLMRSKDSITGVRVRDHFSGDEKEVRGRMVVNTAGGWVDRILEGVSGSPPRVRLSTAMNLVIRRRMLRETALGFSAPFAYAAGSGHHGTHVLFMTPWRDVTVIGTYHQPYDGDPDDMAVSEQEIEKFLMEINGGYPGDPVRREDVSFFYKGFLPMNGLSARTGEVNLVKHYRIHDHAREDNLQGLISVVGVKYTTARDVAVRTVDYVFKKLGTRSGPSVSHKHPLRGGDIPLFDRFLEEAVRSADGPWNETIIRHLVLSYGTRYTDVIGLGKENSKWLALIPDSREVTAAEIVHAVRNEAARTLADAVLRRTDLGSAGNPGRPALKTCADLVGEQLGWSAERRKKEVEDLEKLYVPVTREP